MNIIFKKYNKKMNNYKNKLINIRNKCKMIIIINNNKQTNKNKK